MFFDTARLVKIDFQIDVEDWNKLRLQHRSLVKTLRTDIPPSEQKKPFSYFSANMVIDGTDVGKVAIRKKGFVGSLDQDRPSFKVKIDKYDKKKMFAGVNTLTLNNNKQDGSRIHQLIGYQLFRAAGLPASHCNLALISVNSKSLGIYSNVESLDKHISVERSRVLRARCMKALSVIFSWNRLSVSSGNLGRKRLFQTSSKPVLHWPPTMSRF